MDDFNVGQICNLANGQATVLGAYIEDGIDKIRVELRPFVPSDGTSLVRTDPLLFSTPVENFKALMARYLSDQAMRERLSRREVARPSRPRIEGNA